MNIESLFGKFLLFLHYKVLLLNLLEQALILYNVY